MRTHYDNLKVARNAPPEIIRAAYKVLCQKYHPDKYEGSRDSAERIMRIINAAYAVLSDPEKKKAYDEFLSSLEAEDIEEEAYTSARQDRKPEQEPKQWARETPADSKPNPKGHDKPEGAERQSSPGAGKSRQQPQNHHPWRRYFARNLDYACGGFVLAVAIGLGESYGFLRHETRDFLTHPYVLGTLACFQWMLIECFILKSFGNTPGKKLFGLRLVSNSPQSSLEKRAFAVWVRGVAFGLPILWWATASQAYSRLKRTGKTSWDEDYGFTVDAEPLGWSRSVLATVLMVAFYVWSGVATNGLQWAGNKGIDYNSNVQPHESTSEPNPFDQFDDTGTSSTPRHKSTSAQNDKNRQEWESGLAPVPSSGESAQTQFNRGKAYDSGEGVPQNFTEAARWYRLAAEQGFSLAQQNLGYLYNEGQGVIRDYAQAAYWFRKAAEQGLADSQFNLGYSYYHGRGVAQDYSLAAYWFSRAAEQGLAGAQNNLGSLYYDGQGVAQDYGQAFYWFRKAAEQGIPQSQVSLGWMYMNGFGVSFNYSEALRWNRLGAEGNHPEGFNNLGWLYENGLGVDQDLWKAAELYQIAINKGIEQNAAPERITEAKTRLANVKKKLNVGL